MANSTSGPKVLVSKNGCYLVTGSIPLSRQTIISDPAGDSDKWSEGETFPARESYALCRCGASANKPFCDGSHYRQP